LPTSFEDIHAFYSLDVRFRSYRVYACNSSKRHLLRYSTKSCSALIIDLNAHPFSRRKVNGLVAFMNQHRRPCGSFEPFLRPLASSGGLGGYLRCKTHVHVAFPSWLWHRPRLARRTKSPRRGAIHDFIRINDLPAKEPCSSGPVPTGHLVPSLTPNGARLVFAACQSLSSKVPGPGTRLTDLNSTAALPKFLRELVRQAI
jgi:hypothetical protein